MSKELALVLSNKVNISDSYTQVVEICGRQAQQYAYQADGSTFENTMTFNNIVPVGSLGSTLLGRKMSINYMVTIVVTDANAPQAATDLSQTFPCDSYFASTNQLQNVNIKGVNSALRAFPLQSICENINLSLNNNQTSWEARNTISGFQRIIDKKLLMANNLCPVRPDDQFTNYPDSANVYDQPLNIGAKSHQGYSRNSITAFSYNKTEKVATYKFNISEPLIIPGINTLWDNEQYLANVNNLSLVLNYGKLQTDFVSSASVWNAAGVQLAYNSTMSISISNPQLMVLYQVVDPNLVSIPPSVVYPYTSIFYSPKSQANVDLKGGSTTTTITMSSDTLRFSSLPKRILIWARKTMTTRTFSDADACLALVPNRGCLQVQLGGKSGLMSQCTRDQIWALGVDAGSNQTRESFASGAGSFIIIDPTSQFGVNVSSGDLVVGEQGSINFFVEAQFQLNNVVANLQGTRANSLLADAQQFELVVVAVYDGQMIATPSSFTYNTGVLSATEVKQLVDGGNTVSSEAVKREINGAGLYTPKNLFHKGGKKKGGQITMA